jgi:hypothetical protein
MQQVQVLSYILSSRILKNHISSLLLLAALACLMPASAAFGSGRQREVSGFTCASGSITGAGTDNCTVTLSAAAGSGGQAVSLSSNDTAVTVPSSVTVAAGATTASFTATAVPVSTSQTATLTASAGGADPTFAIRLNAVVSAPVITSATTANGTAGTAFSYQITATNSPNSYAATGLPAGLSVNATGLISGTPTAAGSSTVTLSATNSGGTGSATLTLTVASTTSPCRQNQAIGNFTLCGEAYNDVTSGSSVTVNYSPSAGNGIIVWATWCFNSSCNSSTTGITATIGDNVNAAERCFTASPHGPFVTNANGGAQGSGDFQQHYVWYCPSIPSGVTSFTVTPSSSSLSYLQINVSEWKAGGLSASCAPVSACFENVDNDGQDGNATGGTLATINTSSPTVNVNDLIFAVTEVPCCSFTASPGAGYTGITVAPGASPGMVSEAKAVSSTGVQTATTSWTGGNATWFGVIVPILSAAPMITSATTASGAVGSSFSFQITASNTPTSYGATGLPAGLTVNTSTGLISGTPTAAGTSTVSLTATNAEGTGTASMSLSIAAAGAPVLSVNATSVAFGSVALNSPSYQSVTLTSSGTAPLTINAGTLTGTGFSMSGVSFPLTLNPGQTAQLEIEFDPTAAGAASGTVTLTSNCSSGSTSTISLSGTGETGTTSYEVNLSWNAPSSSPVGVTGYNIYRATGSSASYQLINSSADTSTSYTDSTVASNTSYSYYVESVDAQGDHSVPSNSYTVSVQ